MYEYYTIYAWSDCPYCDKAKELLTALNKQFAFCLVDESPQLLSYLKNKHGWETVPLVFHHEKTDTGRWRSVFIGGYTNLEVALGGQSEDV